MKLNVGCGEFRAPHPWVNIDMTSWHNIQPDVIADVFNLPDDINDLDAVYCGHFLEHVEPYRVVDALQALRERMLPFSIICIVGPDVHRAYEMYLTGRLDKETYERTQKSPIDWEPEWPGDFHHWDCHEKAVARYLEKAGFFGINAHRMTDPILDQFPVTARDAWQCAVTARKGSEF